jgi:hypothetical protein
MKNKIFLTLLSLNTVATITGTELIHIPCHPNVWSKVDNNQTLMPNLSWPLLEELKSRDISNWQVFEWTFGFNSTTWFGQHCQKYTGVVAIGAGQADVQYQAVNTIFRLRSVHLGPNLGLGAGGETSAYVQAINEDQAKYDCIILDGFHRDACACEALKHIKPGGIIILNNANQRTLGINSKKTFDLYAKYPRKDFAQPNHQDWVSCYWIIQ